MRPSAEGCMRRIADTARSFAKDADDVDELVLNCLVFHEVSLRETRRAEQS